MLMLLLRDSYDVTRRATILFDFFFGRLMAIADGHYACAHRRARSHAIATLPACAATPRCLMLFAASYLFTRCRHAAIAAMIYA